MATGTNAPTSAGSTASPSKLKEPRGWLWSLLIGLLILGGIAGVPLLNDASALHIWTLIVMYIVLAQSWNFIGGFAGYSAFGNVAFFGIGAYTTGLMLMAGLPFWLGLLLGGVVAGVLALLFGLPVLRLKGHYFAIATLGIAVALREIITVRDVGGGGGGLMSLPLPGLDSYVGFFYGFLALAVLCLLISVWMTRSRFGYALVAIRESEAAAEALGIATFNYKIAAYILSAVPTALAGGLYAYWSTGFDPPTVFDIGISVEVVLLCFLGGTGTVLGPIIGGIVFELLSYQFQTSGFSLHNTLLGLSIALVTLFLPQGIIRLFQEFLRRPTQSADTAVRSIDFREGVRRVRRFIAANGI